ncbi:sensor histidine kinase [Christiangramia echinicola]|uniref:histidine kinase n=1 Tax=Christiangramia echinicola TaxID=279359 RepID=A0A1H1RGV1_9FLAO|nr:GAF domain-containing sensor histidine kinase [Christiangramia echinicola]SDS34883.1 hypothetical protein SAMN04488552_2886 [Christiangramia echinicola]
MIIPEVPVNEKERLQALHDLDILDTEAEDAFDNIVEMASLACNKPVALITLLDDDRQWIKSKIGTELCDSERHEAYCAHAINSPGELTLVEDATKDERFKNNPLSLDNGRRIRFYSGIPILTVDNYPLGTLCLLDDKPGNLSEDQKHVLKKLGKQVEALLDLRIKNTELSRLREELYDHNQILKDFAGMVSHSLKMPLANMVVTADILKKRLSEAIDETDNDHLNYLKNSGIRLSDYITDILNYYDSSKESYAQSEDLDLNEHLEHVIDLLNITQDCIINLPDENVLVHTNPSALTQIYFNLLSNSFKYNDKNTVSIDLGFSENPTHYIFTVKDNGIGIPEDRQTEIFKLFTAHEMDDRYGKSGNGLGLSTVKKIVEFLGGKIWVQSEEGQGATFNFTIKK